jgi:DNA-directed RNA polymerase I subunit RPA12
MDPPTSNDKVNCTFCKFSCSFSELHVPEVTTKSAESAKPAWITAEEKTGATGEKHAIIEEPCPKCGHPEMYFYTMQLRSVDEGSTVFYECPKCTHKYSVNN